LWATALAATALRTTDPLLLGLILAVVAYVVMSRRTDAPWARSFASFLRLGLFVIAVRVVFQMLFGVRVEGTTLFTIPSVTLPSWAAGVSGLLVVQSLSDAPRPALRALRGWCGHHGCAHLRPPGGHRVPSCPRCTSTSRPG
jgi:energy-coupling factor transport system permease protein